VAHKNRHTLQVQIKDQRGVFHRLLRPGEKLSVGLSPKNDIVVFDSSYPKSYTFIELNGKTCRLLIHPHMRGGIKYQNSTLSFQDLIIQDILPQKGMSFAPGRKGFVEIGDTKIGFLFDGAAVADTSLPSYTWPTSLRKALGRDLLFKALLLLFIGLETWWGIRWGIHLSSVELPPPPPPEAEKVQQRFARFILQEKKPPVVETVATTGSELGTADDSEAQSDEQGEKAGEKQQSRRNKPLASVGLLGLIGGSGESEGAGRVADFLLDQGLVKELDELIGARTTLRTGRTDGSGNGNNSNGNGIDELLDIGMSGGIDDLIADDSGVETVQLQKKGNVNIEAPKTFRGSEAAKGQRSAESVAAVVKSQYARVMYTFNKYLRQDPNLRGKVSLDVTIAADGRVSNVIVSESTIDNAEFIRDLINIMRQLRFPPINDGTVTVNLPFVFNRVN